MKSRWNPSRPVRRLIMLAGMLSSLFFFRAISPLWPWPAGRFPVNLMAFVPVLWFLRRAAAGQSLGRPTPGACCRLGLKLKTLLGLWWAKAPGLTHEKLEMGKELTFRQMVWAGLTIIAFFFLFGCMVPVKVSRPQ